MDNHRRMTRMLGALVASMTIGAFCLDWMQPSQTSASTGAGIGLMAAVRTWEGIRIEARPQDGALRPEESHFIVYRNGTWVDTPSWKSQSVLGSAPVVQVTLLASPGPQILTSAQRSTALDLVRKLQHDYSIPTERIKGADPVARTILSQLDAAPAGPVAVANAE